MKEVYLLIILLIILILFYYNYNSYVEKFTNINYKKTVWVYWENVKRNTYPTYISLCLRNLFNKSRDKYDVILLNETNIRKYLPDLRADFDNLLIAQKTDYYRIALLYKYGGIWIDADIIVMRDLQPIFDKLDEGYDYVGFGCTGYQCTYGYGMPSNWVLGSQKNSILMKKCLDKLDDKLNKKLNLIKNDNPYDDSYHDYGKVILWEKLEELKKEGYKYYHFSSEHDGARDINGYWIHSPQFFDTNKTEFLNESKLLFVVLYNSEISNNKDYDWMMNGTEDRIINGNEWLCSLFKKAFN
jgi:hypothetical protein